jgi:hypothetical protein
MLVFGLFCDYKKGRMSAFGPRVCPILLATALAATPALASEGVEETEGEGEPPTVGYDSGFFARSRDGLFEVVLTATIQPRFSFESREHSVPVEPDPDTPTGELDDLGIVTDRESAYAFSIPRAQLKLGGHVFSESVRYSFQTEWGRGMPFLKDGWIDFGLVEDALHVRVGQMKRPFSRQWLTSATTLELVDRSITHSTYFPGRDLGLLFHNRILKCPKLEWALGVFNGPGNVPWFEGDVAVDPDTGESRVSGGGFVNVPDRFRPAIVARLGYNHGGVKGYSEADLEGGGLRLAIATSGIVELGAGDVDGNVRGELDYILKAHGFSTTGAVYVASEASGDFVDQSFDSVGFHLQGGYLIAGLFQPAVRYALIDFSGEDDRVHKVLGCLSFYFFGHNVKWQLDGGARIHEDPLAGDLTDYVVRTQVQLAF